jgi:hypothetical protein
MLAGGSSRQLVNDENRRALRALRAGGPGWQHIEGAKGQPGSIVAALGAMSAGPRCST